MENIVLEKIPHPRIRKLIQNKANKDVSSVWELKPSFKPGSPTTSFLKHEEVFESPHSVDKTWDHYTKVDPTKVLDGDLVSFGLMLSKQSNEVLYRNQPFQKTELGQVYFMNLKFFKGIVQLAVSWEVVTINEKEKYFEFSYMEGGKSEGIQRITMESTKSGGTSIVHKTYYKSDSNFRDKFIYPYFHTKVLKEYHSNALGMM